MSREVDSSRLESRANPAQGGGFGNFDLLSEMQSYQNARSQDTAQNIAMASNDSKPPVLTPLPTTPTRPPIRYTINGDGTVSSGRQASERVDNWTINK